MLAAQKYGPNCAQIVSLRSPAQEAMFGVEGGGMWPTLVNGMGDADPDYPEPAEDCLYLNVFAPRRIAEGSVHPVLVHIHGGEGLYGA